MSARAVIIRAGGTNFGSLLAACARLGVAATVSDQATTIRAASHVILPGVGAAAPAMRHLRESGLDRVIAGLRQPLLGICLGMQLLFERLAEGEVDGLGLLPGRVERLPAAPRWPHMGWNTLATTRPHPLLAGIGSADWFYFVHGYAASGAADTIACCVHGLPFAAAVARGQVAGMQFHPEKSAAAGRRALANFFALT